MHYFAEPLTRVYKQLQSRESGLTKREAADRLADIGPNEITVVTEPLWRKIVEPFRSIFVIVLFVAAGISAWHAAYVDMAVVLAVVVINAIIYYVQRFSTERILRSLRRVDTLSVLVHRGTTTEQVASETLVPGDVITLIEGDKVPADARIITAHNCQIDESQLTGESLPIEKSPKPVAAKSELYERSSMIYRGSFVVGGQLTAIITETANTTEFGKLAKLSVHTHTKTPVEKKIDQLVTKVIIGITAITLVTFLLALYRGIEMTEALRFVIALAVSAVPEGLPVAITIVLALGMRKMAKKKALTKSMAAIENIGAVTAIATDKTGTLTKNQLSVVKVVPFAEASQDDLVHTMACSVTPRDPMHPRDPLDAALDSFKSSSAKPVQAYSFEHTVAMSGNLYHSGKDYVLYLKGAPERILERADITDSEREKALLELNKLTAAGLRVIAFGHTPTKHQPKTLSDIGSLRLDFDGFVGIADILRPQAKSAIKNAQAAGISVRMITGDHFETAYHIGRELRLLTDRNEVFDCRQMKTMSDDELIETIKNIKVFSRVLPEQKHRLLTLLKKNDIVAMTGDGVNDIPALTNADVGIAMGSGASIARDAGDIVLLNDNFSTIITAIREGRTIYRNIKRMVAFLLATNFGEVLTAIGSLIFGLPLPITPLQLLWINLVTDTSMVIPLGVEPGERDEMKHPPLPAKAPLLNTMMIGRTILVACTMAGATISVYALFSKTHSTEYARTLAFNALVVMQWASAFSFRSDRDFLLSRLAVKNNAFYIGLGVAIVMQLAVLFTPFGALIGVGPVAAGDLIVSSLAAFVVPIIAIEIHKLFYRKR